MNEFKTYLLWALSLLAAAALLTLLWPREAETDAEAAALAEGRVMITHWDRHSGHEHAERLKFIEEFNRAQHEVYVRSIAIGYAATMEKVLTSTAGGAPPDLASLDSGFVAQLAPQGVFLPLDDFVASEPSLHEDQYFPHCWDMAWLDGHVWGIPSTTDAYCLLWNKKAFREAGLDPEQPPRTLRELEEFAARLQVRTPVGRVERMGFVPWLPWDHTYLWGGIFGGEWYDPVRDAVDLSNQPAIAASLAWQQSFTYLSAAEPHAAYALPVAEVDGFSEGARDYFSTNNPFYSGQVAMIVEGEWQVTFIPRYAPGFEWGVAPVPQPENIPPSAYGPTGILDVIPATARHADAAKKFLRWFYTRRGPGLTSPASDYNFVIHNIPPRREEAAEPRFSGNPKFRVFVEQLDRPRIITYPVMPVAQYLLDQHLRQMERVILHEVSPEQAVQEMESMINKELRRVREQVRRGKQ